MLHQSSCKAAVKTFKVESPAFTIHLYLAAWLGTEYVYCNAKGEGQQKSKKSNFIKIKESNQRTVC